MAFPATPLSVTVALQLAGVWTDITHDVYARDLINITRGRADEASQPDPGRCRLTLNNRAGKYSPRNPTSPYYGLIGRNTPIRVSVPGPSSYLEILADGDKATTPDAAALDIVGDIDVRIDVTVDDWFTESQVVLAAKYDNTTSNRSWLLFLARGALSLQWSANGTTTLLASSDANPVIPASGRLAVRAVLDVNNGAGGNTVTFYTSTSVGGAWTQLGSAVTQAGTTSIFASAAVLGVADAATLSSNLPAFAGRVHAFQLRNGIAGTVVANPDFTVQADGATTFVDSAGLTWTVGGAATISTRSVRFRGEVSSWPSRWDVSGSDVYVPIEAAGILRRAGQGTSPIGSTLRVALSGVTINPVIAYWPCEDSSGATSIAAGISGVLPMVIGGAPQISSFNSFVCSDALPVLGTTGTLTGTVPAYTATASMVRFLMALPSGGATNGQVLCSISLTGTIRTVELYYDSSSGGRVALRARNGVGSIISDTGTGTGASGLNGALLYMSIEMTQVGSNVELDAYSLRITDNTLTGATLTPASQTIGSVTTVTMSGAGADTAIGHVSVQTSTAVPTDTFSLIYPLSGYAGEFAGDRIRRLAQTASFSASATGDPYSWATLGVQQSAKILDLLDEAANADMGILVEHRSNGGLLFRGRTLLNNQAVALTLNYANGDLAPPLEPMPDDQITRNNVVVQRKGGSSYRSTLKSGALSILAPPNGVGQYDDAVTLNVATDDQLPQIAGWRLHLGTWDEERYPHIAITLAGTPSLINTVLGVDIGDRIAVTNPPAWLPPGDISQIVQGYTETLGSFTWDIQFNCTPARAWDVAVLDDATLGRLDTDGSTLAAAALSGDTSFTVQTTSMDAPRWTTAAGDVPFNMTVGGEVCTATAVNHARRDAFGRTASSSWGTADSGQAWTTGGGTASDFSVSSGTGRHTLTTVNASRRCTMTAPSADLEMYATVSTSALATGASQIASLMARYVDSSNYFYVRLEFTTTQTCILSVRKFVAGADTQLAALTVPGLVHAASTRYAIRWQVYGTTLRAKAWLASAAEPSNTWHVTATDSTFTAAGQIGCRSILTTGNTNVSPVVDFDDFQVPNPQVITVTRSVNGIVKAQSVGADVRLTTPMILAL